MDAKPRRRYLPRFSLRTLLILVVLFASAFLLWLHWEPWVPAVRLETAEVNDGYEHVAFSPDGQYVLTVNFRGVRRWDASSGNLVGERKFSKTASSYLGMAPAGLLQAFLGEDLPEHPGPPNGGSRDVAMELRERLAFPVEHKTRKRRSLDVLRELVGELNARNRKDGLGIRAEEALPPGEDALPAPGVEEFLRVRIDGESFNQPLELEGAPWHSSFAIAALAAGYEWRYEAGCIVYWSRRQWTHFEEHGVCVYDGMSGERLRILKTSGGQVQSVAFAGGGRFLLAQTVDGSLRVWKTADWSVHLDLPDGSVPAFWCCALSDDGRRVAARTEGGNGFRVWNAADFLSSQSSVTKTGVRELVFSPDGERLLVTVDHDSMVLYALEPLTPLATWQEPAVNPPNPFQDLRRYEFTPDAQRLASLEYGGANAVRSSASGEKEPLPPGAEEMRSNLPPVFTPDGERVVCRDRDSGRYAVWDLRSCQRLAVLPPYTLYPARSRILRALGREEEELIQKEGVHKLVTPYTTSALADPTGISENDLAISPGGERIVAEDLERGLVVWERRRDEGPWGIAALPESWLTAFFALLLVWSLVRDFQTLRRAPA